jgi:hypothetical protein
MRCNEDRNLLKTWIFESAPQQLISYGGGHVAEIQIVKNQHVRNVWIACCVLSHVPSRWPFLRNDSQARMAFIDKIAAPVLNKMFECGMIP